MKKRKNRLKAMQWWYGMDSSRRTKICNIHTEIIGHPRSWETLTGREVEQLYQLEIKQQTNVHKNGNIVYRADNKRCLK